MSFVKIVIFRINLSGREDLAHQAGVFREADTGESVVSVLAEAAVETRIGIALVNFLGAIFASISGPASALEVVDSVLAGSSVGAGSVLAVVIVVLTVATDETILTDTLVVVDELEADPTVLARAGYAVVDHVLTVATLESVWAHAGVA